MAHNEPPHKRLRAWRTRLGLTQKDAAAAARMQQGSWSFIERGEREPSLGQAFRIELLTGGEIRAIEWLSPRDLRISPVARAA